MAETDLSRAPLEELMLSMDVVDTLRHQQELVDRELNAETRRERLLERMRDIYAAQGIEVSDTILAEGVRALEEERFRYTPPERTFAVKVAEIYANRSVWAKPVLFLLTIVTTLALVYYLAVARPAAIDRAELPGKLDTGFAQIVKVSEDRVSTDEARRLLQSARDAIREGDYDRALELELDMRRMLIELTRYFEVRIVSRPNMLSGVWRVPATNPEARNYYLIVEAVDAAGSTDQVVIRNEEDGVYKTVSSWGIRVDEETFEAVAADKRDDGIIQGNVVGEKQRGQIKPKYLIRTTGATITEW